MPTKELKNAILSLLYHPHILTSVKASLRHQISKALRNNPGPIKSSQTIAGITATIASEKEIKRPLSPAPPSFGTPTKKERSKTTDSNDSTPGLWDECYEQIQNIAKENQVNYPYIIPETPDNVLYSREDDIPELKFVSIGNLKGATLDKIVEWIGGKTSLEIRDLIIVTYPNYTTSCELLLKIIKRFLIPWPLAMSSKEAAEMMKERYKVIQSKIVGFIQYWITERRDDFIKDKKLRCILDCWIEYMKKEAKYYKSNKRQIEALIVSAIEKSEGAASPSKIQKMAVNFDPKEVMLPSSVVSYDSLVAGAGLMEFSPELIATQLALIDQKYFCDLTSADFLHYQRDAMPEAPRQRLSDRHNIFTSFIIAYIIKEPTQSLREAVAEKFIQIANSLIIFTFCSPVMRPICSCGNIQEQLNHRAFHASTCGEKIWTLYLSSIERTTSKDK